MINRLATDAVPPQALAGVPPGVYQGFWQMANAGGRPFGERIWAGIQVPAPAVVS